MGVPVIAVLVIAAVTVCVGGLIGAVVVGRAAYGLFAEFLENNRELGLDERLLELARRHVSSSERRAR